MPSVLRAALALAFVPVLIAACGDAGPPPEAPAQPSNMPVSQPPPSFNAGPRELMPPDQEMLKIAKAEEEIDRLFPHAGEERKGAPPSKKGGDQKAPEKAPAAPASAGDGDPCAVACRALASMKSSAEKLCQLAGENDGRCEDARGRVRGAASRVRSVCPACG